MLCKRISPAMQNCGYRSLRMRSRVLCCSRQSWVRVLVHRVKERVAVVSRIRSAIRSWGIHVLRVVIGALRRRQEPWWVTGSKRMGMWIRSMECTIHGCPSIICLILIRRVTVASVTHSRWWGWRCITSSRGTSRISSQHHRFIRTLVWWGWYYTTLRSASCAC